MSVRAASYRFRRFLPGQSPGPLPRRAGKMRVSDRRRVAGFGCHEVRYPELVPANRGRRARVPGTEPVAPSAQGRSFAFVLRFRTMVPCPMLLSVLS
jgi:hypothetical protein